MKKILLGLLTALLFLACSSNEGAKNTTEPGLVVNKSLQNLKLNDQHGKAYTITKDTKKVIFAFSKETGHLCNDFFATKSDSYLSDNGVVFVADVSGAPSLIRSMFIMPGLKDFKHTILIIDDKAVSNQYKTAENAEKIVAVNLKDLVITDIKYLSTSNELLANIQNN